jgi:hypothetical protein
MKKDESKIQQEIVMWFNNNYCLKNSNPQCLIFSVPNEGKNAREQMYKKSLGMKSGVSDLIVIIPNKILFIECKDEKGKQRDQQIDFENNVKNLGFEYHLVRTLDKFQAIIDKEIAKNKEFL